MKERRNPHLIYLGRLVHRSILILLLFLAICGILMISSDQLPWLGFLLIIQFPIALMMREYLWIDRVAKVIKSATIILGKTYSWNKSSFLSIEGILIKRTKMTKTMHSRGSSSTFSYMEYDAYLQLEGAKPFYLFSNKDPEKLMSRVRPVSKELKVDVQQPDAWD